MHMEPQFLVPPRLLNGQVVTRDLREPHFALGDLLILEN